MSLSAHQRNGGHDEWLTPPEIMKALGAFDLDPCSPINRPWPTAAEHYTIQDDGLSKPWNGRVWCKGRLEWRVLLEMRTALDPDAGIWNSHAPKGFQLKGETECHSRI